MAVIIDKNVSIITATTPRVKSVTVSCCSVYTAKSTWFLALI